MSLPSPPRERSINPGSLRTRLAPGQGLPSAIPHTQCHQRLSLLPTASWGALRPVLPRLPRDVPTAQPYLIGQALGVLGEQVDGPALGQEDGSVGGGGGPGAALVLVEDGGEAAVLGGLADEVGAPLLGLQRAALGSPAAAVQAGAALDGGARADLLQHPVEGGGTRREVVQGHGVGDTVHLRGPLLLVGGVVVGRAVVRRQRVLRVLVLPLPRPPAAVEKVLQAMAEHGPFGQLLDFLQEGRENNLCHCQKGSASPHFGTHSYGGWCPRQHRTKTQSSRD